MPSRRHWSNRPGTILSRGNGGFDALEGGGNVGELGVDSLVTHPNSNNDKASKNPESQPRKKLVFHTYPPSRNVMNAHPRNVHHHFDRSPV